MSIFRATWLGLADPHQRHIAPRRQARAMKGWRSRFPWPQMAALEGLDVGGDHARLAVQHAVDHAHHLAPLILIKGVIVVAQPMQRARQFLNPLGLNRESVPLGFDFSLEEIFGAAPQ